MYYEIAENDHGLPHDPLKAIIAPRPIGWISTISKAGVPNLAPYSFFNMFAGLPPVIGFSSVMKKHSQINAEETGEFVYNFPSLDLIDQVSMSASHVPPEVNEFDLAGLTMIDSKLVKPPRVAEARAHMECTYLQTIELPFEPGKGLPTCIVLGRVVAVHIDDQFVKDGLVDTVSMNPITRMGYMDYGTPGEAITKPRPEEIGNMEGYQAIATAPNKPE